MALLAITVAGFLGYWSGGKSVPDDLPAYQPIAGLPNRAQKPDRVDEADLATPVPPLYFAAGTFPPDAWPLVEEEIRLAAAHGVDQVILPLRLAWEDSSNVAAAQSLLKRTLAVNPRARIFIHLHLDPDPGWADARPTEVFPRTAEEPPMASPASELWRDEAARKAAALADALQREANGFHVRGYLLAAMVDGRWRIPAGASPAPCMTKAFREWLKRRYTDNAELQTSWDRDTVTLDTVEPVATPAEVPAGTVFLDLPERQDLIDYREFLSDATADAIAAIMSAIKQAAPRVKVYANYGHTFDHDGEESGLLGMGRLLYGDLDGFAGSIVARDRGIGAAGGANAPHFSAALHQKEWILLDDTRTGIARDPATGQVGRLEGVRPDDVYNVQRRNFALAAVHGTGLAWTDPHGEGWLHDEPQWEVLGQMLDVYADLYAPPATPANTPAASSEEQSNPSPEPAPGAEAAAPDSFEQQVEDMLTPAQVGPPNTFNTGLLVVIDESAMHALASPGLVREQIILPARDAALRSGATVRTCLLQDVLDDIAPGAQVYLFLNAFRLTEAERARLHARFQRDQACAIWCYAPGYLSPAPDTEAIAKTVGMKVTRIKAPAQSGSVFTLGGRWLPENSEIGDAQAVEPLFSIDDPDADIIATYRGGQRGSIALRVLPEGWTSVYVAEPALSPGMLREILQLIERRACFKATGREHFDAAYPGLNLIGIHAKQPGEIALSLGNVFDIQDVFEPGIGWPQKESIAFPVKTGETRLLKLTPLY